MAELSLGLAAYVPSLKDHFVTDLNWWKTIPLLNLGHPSSLLGKLSKNLSVDLVEVLVMSRYKANKGVVVVVVDQSIRLDR